MEITLETEIKTPPKVSIGMPAYNSAKWIGSTIDSILNQSYKNIELIISDNASTDNTQKLCEEIAKKDSRVKYYRNESNIGVSENFNAVFKYATGEYFKWTSSSDLLKETFIEKCLNVLQMREDVVLVCPGTLLFTDQLDDAEEYDFDVTIEDERPSDRFIHYLKDVKLNNIMNGLVRSDVLALTSLYKKYLSADVNMIAELTLYGKLVTLPEFLFCRRMDEETATKYKKIEEVMLYYVPDAKRSMLFQNWRVHFEYFLAVLKSPIEKFEKKRIYRHLLKRVYWDRYCLWNDIKQAVHL